MKKNKILITSLILLLIAALIGGGIWFWQRNRKDNVVKVHPLEYLNMAEYVDESMELMGTISSDFVQEVIPDGSRDIKKIYVQKGQQVKKGDKLLKYNVDEQELDVKLQKLQIQSAKLQIENMEKELQKLKNTKTVGAVDGSNLTPLHASLDLSVFGNDAFRLAADVQAGGVLVAEGSEDSSGEQGSTDNTEASGDSTGSSEEGAETTEESISLAKKTAKGAIKDALSESYDYDVDQTLEQDVLNSYSEKIDAAEDEETITSLRKEALNKLKDISALAAKRDAAKQEIDTYVVDKKYGKADAAKRDTILETAEKEINSAKSEEEIQKAKEEALTKLKELHGGPLYTFIDDANEQQASNSGSGDSALNTIRFLLVKDNGSQPTIAGDVVNSFFNDLQFAGRYIEFRVYDSENDFPKGSPSLVFQMTPDTELKGTVSTSKNYTVPELQKLVSQKEKPSKTEYLLKSLNNYTQHQSGRGTLKSKYKYNLRKNALIKGSVINGLISKKKYALLRDYESDDAYAAGDNPLNLITITPDTVFSEKISGTAKYTIKDLNKLLVSVDSITVTPKKKGLKTVTAGNKYKFTAKVSGSNIRSMDVIWSVSNAKSKATKISSKGVLTVGADEKAAALKITATAGKKKGSCLVKVKKKKGKSGSSGSGDDDDDDDDSDDISGGDDDSSDSDNGDDIYTAEELKEAIAEKEQEIAEARQDLNEAKINYKEAKREVDDAIVKAVISGKVTTAYTAEDAPADEPVVVVRADEGLYVKTAISELGLETVKVGGTIICTSYENNEEYEAEVREIADYPTESFSDSSGNPNSSFYPVVAYIAEAEGLNIGDTVSISYDSQSMGTATGETIFLPKAYVRTENKKSYVYKADKDGRLKKSYVKTGRISGQYIEVTAGLTMDDMLAFPYSKNELEGAKTEVSDDQDDIVW